MFFQSSNLTIYLALSRNWPNLNDLSFLRLAAVSANTCNTDETKSPDDFTVWEKDKWPVSRQMRCWRHHPRGQMVQKNERRTLQLFGNSIEK
jgi:hypothetical protein